MAEKSYISSLKSLFKFSESNSSNYAYVVARVKSKKSKLLKKEQYAKMLNMNLSEIALFMEESEYKKEIDENSLQYSGMDLIEIALYKNLANTYNSILSYSKGELKQVLSLYLARWDKNNMKMIVRVASSTVKNEKSINYIIPAGYYPMEFWKEAIKNQTLEDALEYFTKTDYKKVIEEWKKTTNKIEGIHILEDMIDKYYYEKIVLPNIPDDIPQREIIKNYFQKEIDHLNLFTMLRCKRFDLSIEEFQSSLINGGKDFSIKELAKIYAQPLRDIIDYVTKFSYYNGIKPMLEEAVKNEDIPKITRVLEQWYYQKEEKTGVNTPLSPLPVYNYMTQKFIEVENIRIISRGIEKGFSKKEIEEIML
jgi:V/A-type H+-transporting ATPase subunit C